MDAVYFLINTVCNLYLMVVLLRIWLQLVRADFYNPISQFTVKATQPILKPLRRFIPGFWGVDMAAVVLAILVVSVKLALLYALNPNLLYDTPLSALVLFVILSIIKTAGTMLFWVMLIQALLSWVSQGRSPVEYMLFQLTGPILAPLRRIIPPLGGLDLSVLVAFIILQALNLLMGSVFGPIWWQV
ncbi:MAG: YggT family protein [Aeromonadales bacterium]|nr:YggT family protein [Aeromonadales bacterium]